MEQCTAAHRAPETRKENRPSHGALGAWDTVLWFVHGGQDQSVHFEACTSEQELASELAGALALPGWETPAKNIPEDPEPMERPCLPYSRPTGNQLPPVLACSLAWILCSPCPRGRDDGTSTAGSSGGPRPCALHPFPLPGDERHKKLLWGLLFPFLHRQALCAMWEDRGLMHEGLLPMPGLRERTVSWEAAPTRRLRLNSPETHPSPTDPQSQ